MGACQDCWVFVEGRGTLRACGTLVEDGMTVARR
jgi:predicted molibdopterin-dependent oxidoreductase YjgC